MIITRRQFIANAVKVTGIAVGVASTFACGEASAFLFNRRRRTNTVNTVNTQYTSPQHAADSKADIMAERGIFRHLGGGYGGGNAEGIGRASTANGALNNCCFTGQRTVLGQAVRWSEKLRSYIAVKIYR